MYLLAIDDVVLADLGIAPALITSESDRFAWSVRRRQGTTSQAFAGGANEVTLYSVVFEFPTALARDTVLGALVNDLSTERRLRAQRIDAAATIVVGAGAVTKIDERGDLSFIVEFEAADSTWASERTTAIRKTVRSSLDTALYVPMPGNTRSAPTFRINPIAPRTAPSATVGWSKRRRYVIANNADEPLYRYPLRIDLGATTALVSAGTMLANGNDVRLWIDGVEQPRTLLGMNSAATYLWFIVPALLPGETLTIDVMYGNPAAGAAPVLAWPDLPAFDITASTNGSWVYRTDDVAANAGLGLWWLSKGTEGPIADFGVPGAWQPINTLENPDSQDRTLQTRATQYVATGTWYRATLDAWRSGSNSTVLGAINPFDGVGIYHPLGILSVTNGFDWVNTGAWGTLVVVARDSASEGWDVLYAGAGATAVIASAARAGSTGHKWLAMAVWPDNYIEMDPTIGPLQYSRATINTDTTLAIDSTLLTITLAAAVAVPWTPSILGGKVKAWYDATAITGVVNGGRVRQWNDLSANAYHALQTTNVRQPLYATNQIGGLPALDFNAAGADPDYYATSLPASSRDESVLAVIRSEGSAAAQVILGGPDNARSFRLAVSTLSVARMGGATLASSSATVPATGNAIVGYVSTASTFTFTINGTAEAPVGSATGFAAGTSIVGIDAGVLRPFNGNLAEILVTTSLSAEDRQKAEGYLAHKWGLTASLPAGHPYKSVGPTSVASANEADVYEVASEIRLGGGGAVIAPYTALLVGNARAESGAGVPRVACRLSEALIIDGDARTHEVWLADLTAKVEDVSAHAVRAVTGWLDGDVTAISPTSLWVPLDPNRPLTPNGEFALDIAGWEEDTSAAGLTVTRAWDGAVGGEALGSLAMMVTANTAAIGDTARTQGPTVFATAGREAVWLSAWMQTTHANVRPRLYVRFYDEDDAPLTLVSEVPWTPVADTPVRRSLAARVPGRATSFRIGVAAVAGATAQTGTVWFDDLRVNDTDLLVGDQAVGQVEYVIQARGRWL